MSSLHLGWIEIFVQGDLQRELGRFLIVLVKISFEVGTITRDGEEVLFEGYVDLVTGHSGE